MPFGLPTGLIIGIISIAAWDAVWKLIALWKSAKNNQLGWFIIIAILNTAGILPIIYIAFFQKKKINVKVPQKRVVKKKR